MKIHFIESIKNIDETIWNNLVDSDYPFMQHSFLLSLEESKCVGEGTGWYPFHLVVKEEEDVIALMPMYIKTDSHGEFIFDWSWADAFYRNGLDYYPKLVSAIPFTPASGPRLCVLDESKRTLITSLIKEGLEEISIKLGISSAHILLPEKKELTSYVDSGFSTRTSYSFHWFNNNYSDFDDFLKELTSRQRKNLRKERSKIFDQNIHMERIPGEDITEELWDSFFKFYQITYLKRGMQAYLNLDFFHKISERLPKSLLLVIAKEAKTKGHLAGALNFCDSKNLYGRYWGCLEEYDSLHFESCYYQGIEHCIEMKLNKFDPGVQGEHKIKRGFLPVETFSSHWIKDDRFKKAIDDFLIREREHILEYNERCKSLLPFKSSVTNKLYSDESRIKH
jgi:predicted N-acyltransferase